MTHDWKTKPADVWSKQHGGAHYDQPIQPTIFCYVNKLDVLESNIIKYVCRHKKAGGAEDIKKLIHYAEMILEMEYDTKDNE